MHNIGGYFGLELSKGEHAFHTSLYKMKSGRASLSFILNNVQPSLVYIPFYTCNALLEPFAAGKIPYRFYSVNEQLEIKDAPVLHEGEMLLYINYFGIKNDYAENLSLQYKDRLIIDCTQAYFVTGNGLSWFFNSARKFFGVPDGSDLYVPQSFRLEEAYNALPLNEEYITDHLVKRFNGNVQEGYPYFQQNEILNGGQTARMSLLTERLLSHTDFAGAKAARENNFIYLESSLKETNRLRITRRGNTTAFLYPYLPEQNTDKKKMWSAGIFVPVLWADCIQRMHSTEYSFENDLSENLLGLPCDHRYSETDLKQILLQLSLINTDHGV